MSGEPFEALQESSIEMRTFYVAMCKAFIDTIFDLSMDWRTALQYRVFDLFSETTFYPNSRYEINTMRELHDWEPWSDL